jgi:hypothetical protein
METLTYIAVWAGLIISIIALVFFVYLFLSYYGRNYIRAPLRLSCPKCNELAWPVYNTKNRYQCDDCGCRFASGYHGL